MRVEFAYAQGRIEARNGDRLTSGAWQSLTASRTLAHYLHAVRGTALGSWVQHLGEQAGAHELERSLRADWRAQIVGIATWLPKRWREAMRFCATLPDLPVATHLARDGEVAAWMLDDDRLLRLTGASGAEPDKRGAAESGALVNAASRGPHPLNAWLDAWRQTWPARPHEKGGLEALIRHIQEFASGAESLSVRRDKLEGRVLGIIRRWRLSPAAAFACVVLLALDLQRLRGGLLRRACFSPDRE